VYAEIGEPAGDLFVFKGLPDLVFLRAAGQMLKTYTSGKLPKAFKVTLGRPGPSYLWWPNGLSPVQVIPSLANWEEVLYLTQPGDWTPHVRPIDRHTYQDCALKFCWSVLRLPTQQPVSLLPTSTRSWHSAFTIWSCWKSVARTYTRTRISTITTTWVSDDPLGLPLSSL
jgi:hypothetical protein